MPKSSCLLSAVAHPADWVLCYPGHGLVVVGWLSRGKGDNGSQPHNSPVSSKCVLFEQLRLSYELSITSIGFGDPDQSQLFASPPGNNKGGIKLRRLGFPEKSGKRQRSGNIGRASKRHSGGVEISRNLPEPVHSTDESAGDWLMKLLLLPRNASSFIVFSQIDFSKLLIHQSVYDLKYVQLNLMLYQKALRKKRLRRLLKKGLLIAGGDVDGDFSSHDRSSCDGSESLIYSTELIRSPETERLMMKPVVVTARRWP
ncbi:hypothetical protein E3N88_06745 [Mikania micrantha]|uniref:Uncharacterized protein n=1 Tax=Mikania micrantha TaxID=192012 RepID=A0A5N6PSH2_9ASTR|nr:hypothetical protein E3N88_06745 [Mikania micrantha]